MAGWDLVKFPPPFWGFSQVAFPAVVNRSWKNPAAPRCSASGLQEANSIPSGTQFAVHLFVFVSNLSAAWHGIQR